MISTAVLNLLEWKTLKTQRVKAKGKMMFKMLHNMGPTCQNDLILSRRKY
jgi:hypothetical protein